MKILTLLIPASFIIFFFSCSDTMVNYSDVSGKIYIYDYYPAANVKVTIGDAVTRTGADGSFAFKNISYPYNLTVLDSMSTNVFVYKNLSTDKVNLTIGDYSGAFYSAAIEVNVPDSLIGNHLKGKLIFTDGQYVNACKSISGNSNTTLYLSFPDNEPVSGKVILLTYKIDNSGKIISYENFGVKNNFNVHPGILNQCAFDSADIAFNPGEQTVTGSINFPSGYKNYFSDFYLSFTDKKILFNGFNDYNFQTFSGSVFSIIIPAGISEPFNTFASSNCNGPLGYSLEGFKVLPNSSNILEFNLPSEIISPESFATNVNNSTLFSYSKSTGEGIYEIYLKDRSNLADYYITSSSNVFTLEDIDNSGFGSIRNHNFTWLVRKKGNYNSVNEYVNNTLDNSGWFYTYSNQHEFSTQP